MSFELPAPGQIKDGGLQDAMTKMGLGHMNPNETIVWLIQCVKALAAELKGE